MTEKNTFIINDMTCSHCEATLRKALQHALPGTEVEIDLSSHRLTFTGDKARGEAAIADAGYTPQAQTA